MKNAETLKPLADFTFLADEIIDSDCNGIHPIVVIDSAMTLLPDEDRYPIDYEEFQKYGAELPDVINRKRGISVGCTNYRILSFLNLVEECEGCPLNIETT